MKRPTKGRPIDPLRIEGDLTVTQLVDSVFQAYNAARLREACLLFTRKMLDSDVTVGLSISGALTPAGLGVSSLIPLVEHGFVDWIVATGANLYHDTHFGIGLPLYQGHPSADDVELKSEGVVRIYDILFDYQVLLSTDRFFRELLSQREFHGEMSSADFHYRVGRFLNEREKLLKKEKKSLLAAAYREAVPVFTSAPGDSSIGMNIAAKTLEGSTFRIDPSSDVNQTAAIVFDAKKEEGKSGVLILGGGSPKNFILQTEPQIQEVLGIDAMGHDYFLQFTDARPDTGGLSGATPSEAVSWGKIDPAGLPDTVVCYLDCTVSVPILTSYALASRSQRPSRRLIERLPELVRQLKIAAGL
jgi:deoxyhypusine synthase